MSELLYKRVLIKVSGESLQGDSSSSMDQKALASLASQIAALRSKGCLVSLVVGGGNLFRGAQEMGAMLDRVEADHIGMLATVMNALALKAALRSLGQRAMVFSAIPMTAVCDPYGREKALDRMQEGHVVIFAAGTGNPFFTTDTAATLRAAEMQCDAIIKLTKVDGVYDRDPVGHEEAKRFARLTYQEVLVNRYQVMDATAIALARERGIPLVVCSVFEKNVLENVVCGKGQFTIVEEV